MIEFLMALLPSGNDAPDFHTGSQGTPRPNPSTSYLVVAGAMCAYNNFIYFCGGKTSTGTLLRLTFKYDTVTGVWTKLADIPAAVTNAQYHSMEVVGTKAYVISNTTTLGILDLTTDTWSTRPLATPYGYKLGSGWTTSNGVIYQVGGGSAANSKEVLGYNPTLDTWVRHPDLPNGRAYGSVTSMDNVLYAWAADVSETEDKLYSMDIVAQTGWILTPIRQPMRNAAKLLSFKDRLFSLGGWAGSAVNPIVREIDIAKGAIGENGQLTDPRIFGTSVMLPTGSIWYYGGNVLTTNGSVKGDLTEYKTGMSA